MFSIENWVFALCGIVLHEKYINTLIKNYQYHSCYFSLYSWIYIAVYVIIYNPQTRTSHKMVLQSISPSLNLKLGTLIEILLEKILVLLNFF